MPRKQQKLEKVIPAMKMWQTSSCSWKQRFVRSLSSYWKKSASNFSCLVLQNRRPTSTAVRMVKIIRAKRQVLARLTLRQNMRKPQGAVSEGSVIALLNTSFAHGKSSRVKPLQQLIYPPRVGQITMADTLTKSTCEMISPGSSVVGTVQRTFTKQEISMKRLTRQPKMKQLYCFLATMERQNSGLSSPYSRARSPPLVSRPGQISRMADSYSRYCTLELRSFTDNSSLFFSGFLKNGMFMICWSSSLPKGLLVQQMSSVGQAPAPHSTYLMSRKTCSPYCVTMDSSVTCCHSCSILTNWLLIVWRVCLRVSPSTYSVISLISSYSVGTAVFNISHVKLSSLRRQLLWQDMHAVELWQSKHPVMVYEQTRQASSCKQQPVRQNKQTVELSHNRQLLMVWQGVQMSPSRKQLESQAVQTLASLQKVHPIILVVHREHTVPSKQKPSSQAKHVVGSHRSQESKRVSHKQQLLDSKKQPEEQWVHTPGRVHYSQPGSETSHFSHTPAEKQQCSLQVMHWPASLQTSQPSMLQGWHLVEAFRKKPPLHSWQSVSSQKMQPSLKSEHSRQAPVTRQQPESQLLHQLQMQVRQPRAQAWHTRLESKQKPVSQAWQWVVLHSWHPVVREHSQQSVPTSLYPAVHSWHSEASALQILQPANTVSQRRHSVTENWQYPSWHPSQSPRLQTSQPGYLVWQASHSEVSFMRQLESQVRQLMSSEHSRQPSVHLEHSELLSTQYPLEQISHTVLELQKSQKGRGWLQAEQLPESSQYPGEQSTQYEVPLQLTQFCTKPGQDQQAPV